MSGEDRLAGNAATEEHVSSEESVVYHGSGVCGSCGTVSGRNLLTGQRNEIMSSMRTELQEGVQAFGKRFFREPVLTFWRYVRHGIAHSRRQWKKLVAEPLH